MLTSATQKKEFESELTLFEQIENTRKNISQLNGRLNYETDPKFIDEIIFLLCAAESKYSALLDKARKKAC